MDKSQYNCEFYEQQIKKKLIEKGDSRYSPQNNLLRTFRFIDLKNTGLADFTQFTKAMAKLGVVFNNNEEVHTLFKVYDHNNNGFIDYNEFCKYIFTKDHRPKSNKIELLEDEKINIMKQSVLQSFQKLKKEIFRKKLGLNLISLELLLKGGEHNKGKEYVRLNEVVEHGKQLGLALNVQDLQKVFEYLDPDDHGQIELQILMGHLKQKFNNEQIGQLKQVYSALGNGITTRTLQQNCQYSQVAELLCEDTPAIQKDLFGSLHQFQVLWPLQNPPNVNCQEFIHFASYLAAGFIDNHTINHFLAIVFTQQNNNYTFANKNNQQLYQNNNPNVHQKDHKINFDRDFKGDEKVIQKETVKRETIRETREQSEENMKQLEFVKTRVRQALCKRGTRGFMGLQKVFQQVDLNKEGGVSRQLVKRVFKDVRVELSDHEHHVLLLAYGNDQDQLINYRQMVMDLMGQLGPQRLGQVHQVFSLLDPQAFNIITIQQIIQFIAPRNHPSVKNGTKSQDDIIQDFTETLELFQYLQGRQYDNQLTKEDFLHYFRYFSAGIPDDQLFEHVVGSVFRLYEQQNKNKSAGVDRNIINNTSKNSFYNKQYTQQPLQQVPFGREACHSALSTKNNSHERNTHFNSNKLSTNNFNNHDQDNNHPKRNIQQYNNFDNVQNAPMHFQQKMYNLTNQNIVKDLQDILKERGLRGFISLHRLFTILDSNKSGEMELDLFKKVLNDLQLKISEQKINKLFEIFSNQNDRINYQQLLSVVRGEMNETRRNIVQKAYLRQRNSKGQVLLAHLLDNYQYYNHPYVLSEEITEQEAKEEFSDNLQILLGNDEDDMDYVVSQEQFHEFYKNYSAVIDDEEEFTDMLTLTWDLTKPIQISQNDMRQDFRSKFY